MSWSRSSLAGLADRPVAVRVAPDAASAPINPRLLVVVMIVFPSAYLLTGLSGLITRATRSLI